MTSRSRSIKIKCDKCENDIINKEYLKCSTCQNNLHIECTKTVTRSRFLIMTAITKKIWKCLKCRNAVQNVQHSTPRSPKKASPEINLQKRELDYAKNESPNTKIPRSLSEENLTSITTDSDLSADSYNSASPRTPRSLPNVSSHDLSIKKGLRNEIDQLKLKLLSAHEEIERLNSEVTSLTRTLNSCHKQMSTYKKILGENTPQKTTPVGTRTKKVKSLQISKKLESLLTPVQMKNTPEPRTLAATSNIDDEDTHPVTKPLPLKRNYQYSEMNNNKLCIISSNKRNKVRQIIENALSDDLQICHFLKPNAGIKELLQGIYSKTMNFTKKDHCVICIGEEDFRTTNNYVDLVFLIRETLQDLDHTNFIICLPTYKCNHVSGIFNWRVETFNNLLYLDVESHRHAFLNDSNLELSYDYNMFHSRGGVLNNYGFKRLVSGIKKTVEHVNIYNREQSSHTCTHRTEKESFNIIKDHPIIKNNFVTSNEETIEEESSNSINHSEEPSPQKKIARNSSSSTKTAIAISSQLDHSNTAKFFRQ